MKSLQQSFTVSFKYPIHFTNGLFNIDNPLLRQVVEEDGSIGPRKIFIALDSGVAEKNPQLIDQIKKYFKQYNSIFEYTSEPFIIKGGEEAKNDPLLVDRIIENINQYKICRHSYVIAIGGGSVLDLVGYAAAISHRGIRHIRIPTTVLSQNDSGIGVKNGINAFNKKNFLGTFTPPYAVLNDLDFLKTLDDRNWRAGISEAIKVALIKDASFFEYIKENTSALVKRDMKAMEYLIYRCAEMHMNHIAGKDPFESGSSRPLDFGHWAAHKLEQLSNYAVIHGEAVAIGIALDTTYSYLIGMLSKEEWITVLDLISDLGFDLYVPEMSVCINEPENPLCILKGLSEFREHLGGRLTIMLLEKIGKGVEVNKMDQKIIAEALTLLEEYQIKNSVSK